jgi:hypothetical protein
MPSFVVASHRAGDNSTCERERDDSYDSKAKPHSGSTTSMRSFQVHQLDSRYSLPLRPRRDFPRGSRRIAGVRFPALFASPSIALATCGGDDGREPAAEGLTTARTAATPILAQPPHLGVSCRGESNVITCDRVGLAVGLSAPAIALEAWIGGQPVAMGIRPDSAEREGQGRYFEGHLHPAGLSSLGPLHVIPDGPNDYWAGGNPVCVPVRLIAHYPDGSSAETMVQIELQPGWG